MGNLILPSEKTLVFYQVEATMIHPRSLRISILLSIILLTQTACNPFLVFRPNSEDLVKNGWADQPSHQKEPTPLYCYNTLGHKVCHSAPLDDQRRLQNYYGPRPY
jgi:hypothetical protein